MVDVLPHPSIAVNVLFCERRQFVLVTGPSDLDSFEEELLG